MLRWGIIGAGAIASGALAPAMRATGHDIAVVGSRSLTRAQAFAASHGARRARGSYEEVLEAADVDAVYVALPNDAHERWTTAALEAGKHVLCEKPLALDAGAAARMAAASSASGRLLMEAVMTRFHPRTAALLELVHSGKIGALSALWASFAFPMSDAANFRAEPARGGGALLDVGIYAVATSRWLAGEEPDSVRALRRVATSGVDVTTAAVLAFPSGALSYVHASFASAPHQLLEIIGTEGALRVPLPFTAGAAVDAEILHDGEVIGTWRANPYERMLDAFARAASGGGSAPLPVEDAVASATVLDAIRDAA